jgi:alcohol dehydrogenase class IV
VDEIAGEYRDQQISVVVGIGGGSAVDAGKAVSAMLCCEGSVSEYLEGVGTKTHSGTRVPFIAVPTTSGTGSEATKNAVLSRVGPGGFKKSLRHDNFVPDLAVIDPELTVTCPRAVTAACGMDALSQLLESYVSTQASPMIDQLAADGLRRVVDNLEAACGAASDDVNVRAQMAYAAFISGVALANAGLGVIHGLAAPIGGFFPIPHGVVCGTLLGPAVKVTIEGLSKNSNDNRTALARFAIVGSFFGDCSLGDIDGCCEALVRGIYGLTERLEIPLLSDYGVTRADCDRIVEKAGNKNNPVALGADQIRRVLLERIKD